MRPGALDVLSCAECGGALSLADGRCEVDGHVMSGTLACTACRAAFAVRDGIPRLVPRALAQHVKHTVEGFGYQWNAATALFDTHFDSPDVFLDFVAPVRPEFFQGKAVLDAGCGSGRFTINAARFGARLVVGVDLSAAVDVAFEKTRHLPNVTIVQGDLLRLPVRAAFDYAFSVGVLHHTAAPRDAFLEVVSRTRQDGAVSAWVYGKEGNEWVLRFANPVRRVTSRLPRRVLLALAFVAAVPLTLLLRLVYRPVSRRPALGWLKRRLFYFDYLAFLSRFEYRAIAFVVFDHAVPEIAEYISRPAFEEWFRAAGLRDVTISQRNGNSWRGFGVRAQR